MKIPFFTAWQQRRKQITADIEELERRRKEVISLRKSHEGLVALVRHLIHHASDETRRDLTSEKPVERQVTPGRREISTEPLLEIEQGQICIRGYNTYTVYEFIRRSDGTICDLRPIS